MSVPLESILQEAHRLTHGDRNTAYGSPLDDYTKTAAFFTTILEGAGVLIPGAKVEPEIAALCMVAVKMSRLLHAPKRDSAVDLAGYAWVFQEIIDEKARRARADDEMGKRIAQFVTNYGGASD